MKKNLRSLALMLWAHPLKWGSAKLIIVYGILLVTSSNYLYAQDNIVYPASASSRIKDVTLPPYNADKTGVNDATAAIQAALNATGYIYLPNGTYKVSAQLRWGGTQKRTVLQGQSRDGTIIKLVDGTTGFTDPNAPKGVIWTGTAPAQRFSNGIRNLTVNTGSGNPGASGIQFMSNNQGTVDNVLIKNNDGNGIYGLDLGYSDEQGPCLIKRLEVQGFNIGIRTKYAVDGVVMSNITLKNQKQFGIHNDGQCLSIENLTTNGTVPALYNTGAGVVAIINSTFTGTGAASGLAAMTNLNGLFARNITTTGFLKAIDNQKGGNTSSATTLTEFVSHPVLSAFTSTPSSLNLTIKPTPEFAPDVLTDWVNVGDYPASTITLPNGTVVTDYTNAFQSAIDAGKPTVYFGNGSGPFYGTVTVRGNVKQIKGMNAWMGDAAADAGSNQGTLIIDNGTSPTVTIEGFLNSYNQFHVIHNSARTAAIKTTTLENVTVNTGAGDLFLEDVIVDGITTIAAGTNVYARQLNCESLDQPRVVNNGNLWILGLKTERDATAIGTSAGAKTEVIGGFIYANKSTNPDKILFQNAEGAQFSATVGEWVIRNQPFTNLVQETRDGVTRLFKKTKAYGRGQGSMLPLYVAKRPVASVVPNAAPTSLAGTVPRYDQIKLTWNDTPTNEDGFLIERKVGSNPTYDLYEMTYANQTSFNDSLLSPSTTYSYRIKAVNSLGASAYSNVVTLTTLPAPAVPTAPTNMVASLTDANILVTWNDNATTETGYKLERKLSTDANFTQIALLPANTTSYYQVGLPGNSTYEYRVKAYLEISESAYSNVGSATISTPTELVVHWKMDELSGITAGDASRHARNGSLRNGLAFGTNSITGVQGKAIQLDGVDDLVRGDDDGRYITSENYPFSMSAWVKTLDDGVILHLGDKDRQDMFYTLSVTSAGEARLTTGINSTTGVGVNGPIIKDNNWHLVTGVFASSTTHRLYVDGVLVDSLVGSFPFHRYMTRFCAGAKEAQGAASLRLAGAIDDARLYSRVLTSADVLNLFNGVTVPGDTQAPTAPTGLAASSITSTSVVLNWAASTDNVAVTGYDVFKGSTKVNTTNITGTTFTVTGLTAGSVYSFTVKAKDAAGNISAASNAVSVTTSGTSPDTQAPTAPGFLTASNATATSVELNWTASTDNIGVAGYDIYNGATKINSALVTGTTYTATGLVTGTTYSFTVKAKDAAGNVSAASNAVSVTPTSACGTVNLALNKTAVASTYGGSTTSPSKAIDGNTTTRWASARGDAQYIRIDLGSIQAITCIKLNWASDYGKNYIVQVSPDNVTYTTVYSTTTGAGGIVDILNLSVNARYVKMSGTLQGPTTNGYSLWEFSVFGNGTVPPPADTQAPTAPGSAAGSGITTSEVTLDWTPSTDNVGVSGYDVYNGSTKVNASNITDLTYTVTGLTPNTSYNFTIKAKDAAGNVSAASNIVNVTTDPICGSVNVALNKTAAASTYGSSTVQAKYAFDGSTTTRWASARGDAQWIRVDLGSLQPITCMTLNWASDYGKSYKVQVSTDNIVYTDVYSTTTGSGGIVEINGLSVTARYVKMIGTLQGPTTNGYSLYEFSIFGDNSGALMGAENDANLALKSAAPVSKAVQHSFTIAPNPAIHTASLNFNASNSGKAQVIIYNQSGQEVYNEKSIVAAGENVIDVKVFNLASGLYIVKLKVEGQAVMTGKLLKQ